MNRVVREHIRRKIDAEYHTRLQAAEAIASANAADTAKEEIAAFEQALETFKAARKVAREAEQRLKSKGVTVHGSWDDRYNSERLTYSVYNGARSQARSQADAWRSAKHEEFETLEFELALTKDKKGVVEAFLKGLSQ